MTDPQQKVGIIIESSYVDKGSTAAQKDLSELDKQVQNTTGEMKQMATASQQIARETDAVGAAAGASARQVGTLAKSFLTGNFDQVARTAGSVAMNIGGIALAGIAAVATVGVVVKGLADLVEKQEGLDRTINQINTRLGVTGSTVALTRTEIRGLMQDLEHLPTLNRADALGILGAANGAGLDEAQFRRVVLLANDYAFATGTTATAAVAKLGAAVGEGGKALLKMDQSLNILTLDQYQSIQQFIRQGDSVRAAEVFLAAYEARLKGIRESAMTPLDASTDKLSHSWEGLTERLGATGSIDRAADRIARIVSGFSWLIDHADAVARALGVGQGKEDEYAARGEAARKASARDQADAARRRKEAKDQADQQEKQDDEVRKFMDQKLKQQAAAWDAEMKRRGAAALQGYLDGIKFDEQSQAEIDKAVADMNSRLKAREYYENIYGPDITSGKTTEELKEYHEQRLKAIDDLDEIEQANARAVAGFDEHGKAVNNVSKEYKDLQNAIEGWGRDTSRGFAQFVVEGEASFQKVGDAAKRFLEDLIAIQIQKRVMDPLLKEGTSFLDSIFGSSGGSGGASDAINGFTSHAGSGPGDVLPTRYVHPAYFERAPRAHSGIGPNERPMIITKDESVLTPGQMRAIGGPRNLRVEIVNQGSPKDVQAAEPRIDVDGTVVRVLLRDQQVNGPITRGLQSTFGLKRGG